VSSSNTEFFGRAAAALGETRVANLAIGGEDLSARLAYGLSHVAAGLLGDALVALAMVVGAYVEDGVVLAVVPSDKHVVLADEREEVVAALLRQPALLHLGQQPRPRDDGMGLEQLQTRGGAHLVEMTLSR
jgi:hypothetical protein